jgi:prophage DNA circulation protein
MSDAFGRTLLDAAFEGVSFPVTDSHVEGGHDIVEHTAYLRDGADIEPCGYKALRGKLTIPLLNDIGLGTLFPRRLNDLRDAIKANPLGQLTHPTEGILTASLHSFRIVATAENRSGVMVEVEWIEHNATATSGLTAFGDDQDTPGAAEQSASATDDLMDEILNGTS